MTLVGRGEGVGGPPRESDLLFAGPGEMRARCRAHDWASTALGPVEEWPASLRVIAATVLGSGFPSIIRWGPDLLQIYNDAYRPFLGEKHPWALGRSVREVWPEASAVNDPVYARVFRGETIARSDERYLLYRHGHDQPADELYLTSSFSPVMDDAGAVGGVYVVVIDTTAEVEARGLQMQLAAERARLHELFRQAPVAIAVLRGQEARDLVYELANPHYVETVPAGREILGRPLREVLPEMEPALLDVIQRVLDTGEPFVASGYRVPLDRDRDGVAEDYYFNFVYHPLLGADRMVDGIVSIGTEVSDLVEATEEARRANRGLLERSREVERLLAASERSYARTEQARARAAHLYALATALSTATTPTDVATAVVTHAAAVFGAVGVVIARLDAAGEQLEIMQVDGMPPDVRDAWQFIAATESVPLADAARTGEPIFLESPTAWLRRYPDVASLLAVTGHAANAVAPLVADGRVLGTIGIAFDAPHSFDDDERAIVLAVAAQSAQALERARLHEAEREARRGAEAANRAKSEFLAIMSHELRTPLNAIDGYAELMELGIRGPVTEQQLQDLARIRKSQRHLLGLVNGVLNYSRTEAGALHYEVEDVQLDEVLATCEALVAPQVRAKGLQLGRIECDPALVARADREKLRQVVLNLLTNATKFTDPGGRIDLACTRERQEVRITVTDTGRGIPLDQRERVFEPFVQLDSSLTRTQEGVGLGLAISRDLARGMGGDLTVESGPAGSVFTLALPSAR